MSLQLEIKLGFLKRNFDTSNMLDAQRFILELNIDEMNALLEKYSEPM